MSKIQQVIVNTVKIDLNNPRSVQGHCRVSLRLYTDDKIFRRKLTDTINSELDTLSEWFHWNMFATNSSKTQTLTLRSLTYNYSLKMNDLPIEIKESL